MKGEREDKEEECEREGPWFLHNHILIKKAYCKRNGTRGGDVYSTLSLQCRLGGYTSICP